MKAVAVLAAFTILYDLFLVAFVTKQTSTNYSETISTSGWPKGVYIVKVIIGKEEYTEKVIMK